MGIPGFFKWLTNPKRYPNIVQDCIEYEPYYGRNLRFLIFFRLITFHFALQIAVVFCAQ